MEPISILLIVIIGFALIKILTWLIKTGICLVLLPIKIFFLIILSGLVLFVLPFTIIPAILSVFVAILPIILIVFGIVFLIKCAT